ncbi:Ribonuclease H domain [Dillenia turbinata]|uniref:Ribonuclease H domain n=1 Tax=Dillenia turbinata TaxID=194707 RepID=A0AAN8VR26_9MAGN
MFGGSFSLGLKVLKIFDLETSWLKAGVKGFSTDVSILDSSKFVAKCSRNIKNVRMLPMQVARRTISFSSEIKNVFSKSPSREFSHEKWVCWSPPMEDNIKLNTDGSVSQSNGHAAAEGILRNARGEWIVGFFINVGTYSILAKLWGVREWLNLANRKGLRNIELEVDSVIIDKIKLFKIKYYCCCLRPLNIFAEKPYYEY